MSATGQNSCKGTQCAPGSYGPAGEREAIDNCPDVGISKIEMIHREAGYAIILTVSTTIQRLDFVHIQLSYQCVFQGQQTGGMQTAQVVQRELFRLQQANYTS